MKCIQERIERVTSGKAKCDCGYEFLQKRLITQKTKKYPSTGSAREFSGSFCSLSVLRLIIAKLTVKIATRVR